MKWVDMMIVTSWHRWLVALLVLAIATGFNFAIQPVVNGRAPFLPYFPALALVGLVAGLGPGVGMLLASICVVGIFWVEPLGVVWPIANSSDTLAMVLFFLSGTVVLACAAGARYLLSITRKAREAYGLALQAGKMAAWNLDVQTDVLTFTEGADKVLGTSILPKKMHDGWPMVNAADRGIAQVAFEHAIQSGQHFKLLTRIGESNPAHWVETHGRVTRAPTGNVQINAVMVDVTERQQALLDSEAASHRLQEEAIRKDTFLATLSHELRNPLAPIRYAVAMLGDDATPAVRQKAKEVIARQSSHMARLLDDLLDISRITRNAIELQREVVDLREIARDAIENVRPAAEATRTRVVVAESGEPVFVDGDTIRLQQVLGNLLDNALKFTAPGGRVTVRIDAEGDNAIMEITDTGIGIDPISINKVFELFAQLQPGRDKGGLGVGLAVVKQLVELHNGSITVHSEGAGTGTRCTVQLPRAQRAAVQALCLKSKVAPSPDSRRVLIVDDSVDAADLLAACVRDHGYEAIVAYTGREALNCFRTFRPRVVLLDIGLPDLRGTEVAREIRLLSGGSDTQLAAITGWGQEKDRAATNEAGFNVHFVKPVDPEVVLEWLQQKRDPSNEVSPT